MSAKDCEILYGPINHIRRKRSRVPSAARARAEGSVCTHDGGIARAAGDSAAALRFLDGFAAASITNLKAAQHTAVIAVIFQVPTAFLGRKEIYRTPMQI